MPKEPKEPVEGSEAEETKESKSEEAAEQGGEGVTVSEEYQKKAHHVTHKATKHELDHLRSKMHGREDDLRKEEDAKKPKGKGFDASDMPSVD